MGEVSSNKPVEFLVFWFCFVQLHDLACKALLLITCSIVFSQRYKTLAKASHHILSLYHTCSAHGEHHFQNHYERSAQQKCVPKAWKNSIPWPWNCRSRGPMWSPDLDPDEGTRRLRNSVAEFDLCGLPLQQAKKRAFSQPPISAPQQLRTLETLTEASI